MISADLAIGLKIGARQGEPVVCQLPGPDGPQLYARVQHQDDNQLTIFLERQLDGDVAQIVIRAGGSPRAGQL